MDGGAGAARRRRRRRRRPQTGRRPAGGEVSAVACERVRVPSSSLIDH